MLITDPTWLAVFPWLIVKIAIIILLSIYLIFAVLILRQEQLMSKVIQIPAFPFLKIVSVSHFIAAVLIFFLALVIL